MGKESEEALDGTRGGQEEGTLWQVGHRSWGGWAGGGEHSLGSANLGLSLRVGRERHMPVQGPPCISL